MPELPFVPLTPLVPELPVAPLTPDVPDVPLVPLVPAAPLVPEEPFVPDVPFVPLIAAGARITLSLASIANEFTLVPVVKLVTYNGNPGSGFIVKPDDAPYCCVVNEPPLLVI